MKTLALCAAILAAVPASAADRTGEVSLGLSGGAGFPFGTKSVRENSKIGPDYGFSIGYGLSEHFEGAFSYDTVRMSETRPVRVDPWLFSLVHAYDHGGYWMPMARVGAGMAVVHGTRPLDLKSYSTLAARTGLGFEYRLTPAVGLGAWADYLFAARANRDTREVHAATFSLALSWHLGKPRAAAAKTAAMPAAATAAKPAARLELVDAYKEGMAQERREKVLMVWDGASMTAAPDGFTNPLTDEAMSAGWRPVVADGKVVGACDAEKCTSEALQSSLFKKKVMPPAGGAPKKGRVRRKTAEPAATPEEVQAPPAE